MRNDLLYRSVQKFYRFVPYLFLLNVKTSLESYLAYFSERREARHADSLTHVTCAKMVPPLGEQFVQRGVAVGRQT